MKHLFTCLTIIFLSHTLLAEDDELFKLGGKLHFFNGIDSAHPKANQSGDVYTSYMRPSFDVMASLNTKFSESVSFESSLTSANNQTCDLYKLLRTASLTLNFHELFSIDVGCLKLEQGGWRDREDTSFSHFDTTIDHAVRERKFGKSLNLNLHFMGVFRVQLTNDDTREDHRLGQIALNTAWIIDLFGTQPILQVGFYENFKSFHYTIGLRGQLANFHFRADFTRDHHIRQSADTIIRQIESVYVLFKAHKFVQPYLRYINKSTEKGKVYQKNDGDHLNNDSWLQQGQEVSVGNEFAFSEQIAAYLATNIKWANFENKSKEQLKWDVRLGLKGNI